MRLAIISHALYVAGGQSVALSIVNAVFENIDSERDRLLIIAPDIPAFRELQYPVNVDVFYVQVRKSVLARFWFDEIVLPKLIKRWKADAIFALGNFGLRQHDALQAVLFHNSHRVYPELKLKKPLLTRLRNHIVDTQIRRTLPVTDIVYCQTNTMAQRFRTIYQFEKRIGILPNAVSARCLEGNDTAGFWHRLEQQLPPHTITLLCLTRYYPHKNIEVILDTFNQYRCLLHDVSVVFTIEKSECEAARKFLKKIETMKLGHQLINIGAVAQENLAVVYSRVDGLILPTLLESFSGTYAEAMQFGKTILTSDRDFAREVCGPAAIYFEPQSAASVFEAIQRFKSDMSVRQLGAVFGSTQLALCTRPWQQSVAAVIKELLALRELQTAATKLVQKG